MSTTLRAPLTPAAKRTLELLHQFPQLVLPAIQGGMNKANNVILAKILPARFSGAGPFPIAQHRLGERTGHLYDAIRVTDAVIQGNTVVTSMGANLGYFFAHELGFSGTVKVKDHLRRTVQSRFEGHVTSQSDLQRLGLLTKKGKVRKGVAVSQNVRTSIVTEHERKMNIPARAPLQTGVKENLDLYGKTVSDEVVKRLGEY